MAAAFVAGGFLLSSGASDSDYFGPNEPTWVRVPTSLGDPVYVGILVLRAAPGDVVELDSLLVDGLMGDADVSPLMRILRGETRILGGSVESDLSGVIDLSSYVPLPKLRFSSADGPVEFAVRVVGSEPVHGFDGLRLRFRLNDMSAMLEDWIPMRASICTASTRSEAVEICQPIADQMASEGP